MDEGFQTHNGIKWDGHVGTVQYGGGDSSMVVMFYTRPVVNPAMSNEVGRPYFDDKVYVRIHPPGERLNIIDRLASASDKQRFPIQYQQFTQNAPQISNGTPIDLLFPASPAQGAALKASGVHTIEQCAKLSAHAIESIGMGAQQWCNDAQRYLEVADKGVKSSQLKAALDAKDREIHALNHKVDLLETELNSLRDTAMNAVSMKDVQQMIAQQGGGGKRAVFAPGKQLSPTFDAQTAQINGTHATRDLAKAKPKAKKAQEPEPALKRQRARLG